MYPTIKRNLMASATLTELIKDNKRILDNRIKKETIISLIKILLSDKREAKYCEMLRVLVNCNGSAIISNQAEICY